VSYIHCYLYNGQFRGLGYHFDAFSASSSSIIGPVVSQSCLRGVLVGTTQKSITPCLKPSPIKSQRSLKKIVLYTLNFFERNKTRPTSPQFLTRSVAVEQYGVRSPPLKKPAFDAQSPCRNPLWSYTRDEELDQNLSSTQTLSLLLSFAGTISQQICSRSLLTRCCRPLSTAFVEHLDFPRKQVFSVVVI